MQFSIISISETWLRFAHLVDTDGSTFVHHYRIDKRGGGTILYILKNIQFKAHNCLVINNMVIAESTFVEITKPQRNIIVRVIHRPPEYNIDIFLSEFNVLLGKIAKENKLCYLMGIST